MKVYGVSSGHYSDWRIVAIFASKRLAREAIKRINSMAGEYEQVNGNIEEWEVHDLIPEPYISHRKQVSFSRDGKMLTGLLWGPEDFEETRVVWPWDYEVTYFSRDAVHVEQTDTFLRVTGTDLERVRKVFGEQKMLRAAKAGIV